MEKEIRIRAIAYRDREAGAWIAQGIEFDITAHATEISRLPAAFEKALVENLCINTHLGREGLNGIPPAPPEFANMFDLAAAKLEAVERQQVDRLPRRAVELRLLERAA